MESESGINNTKISDSGYSNSCSNTNSQGSASSKSRHSGSNSSRSSGYGGVPNPGESVDSGHQATTKRNKDRVHKRKKLQAIANVATLPQAFMPPAENLMRCPPPSVQTTKGFEHVPSAPAVEIDMSENVESGAKTSEHPSTEMVAPLQAEIEPFPDDVENIDLQSSRIDKSPTEKSENEMEKEFISSELEVNTSIQPDGGFSCVISMYDGVVLYTTPSLTSVLGFPKDMWLGCSFIDLVHPKDREIFTNKITTSVSLPLVDSEGKLKDIKNYLYVCLRRYKGLQPCGSGAVENQVSYQAFHLTVTIKQIEDSSDTRLYNHKNGLFLFIIAVPVFSAFKVPGERKKSTKFGMRHTATCIFSHVDPDVVTNFGFLPQDMLGKSVFDFYHPEDMPFLKEVYKSVMKTCQINGSIFRSKPYRFLVQNGCFAMIETEWSSVLNPWSRRIEFVISLHQVLQGPLNPNVFDTTSAEELKNTPEKIIKQGKVIQAEIIQILTEEFPQSVKLVKEDVSKRCKDLADFMKSLISETATSKLQIDVPQGFNPTISERESVLLGEISPHHEFYDSKSSTETPPSYNQLNYNENIHRFFQSNPKTTFTSDESTSASNVNMDVDGKNSQECNAPANNQKCLSPIQNSGASGCGSAGYLSSESNANLESGTTSGTSNYSYKRRHLTESILVRHNEDMEKIMIRKHREERTHNKDRDTKKSKKNLEKYANKMPKDEYANEYIHGLKRSGSHSRDGDCHKISKPNNEPGASIFMETNNALHNNQRTVNIQNPLINIGVGNAQTGISDLNMWSPFPVTANPMTNIPYPTGMLPVYYIPTLVQPRPGQTTAEQHRYLVQYLPAGVLCNYNPIICPPQIFCPHFHPSPFGSNGRLFGDNIPSSKSSAHYRYFKVNPGPSGSTAPGPSGNGTLPPSDRHQLGTSLPRDSVQTQQCHRPSSQATSVKAEPGSRMGSIASASVVNKALSECSRKDLGLQSVCSPGTPLVSPPDSETQAEQFKANAPVTLTNDTTKRTEQPETSYRNNNRLDEGSSCYSSSYSSFLKTCSGSNDDSTSNSNTNQTDYKQQRKTYPLRKKDPPWVESVSVSSDLIYKYQVAEKDLEDVLKSDLNTLRGIDQPVMVNDQLHQLYLEMELEGLSKALTLEEGYLSSNSSTDENSFDAHPGSSNQAKRKRKSYSSLMMIYEEDAALPPPEANSELFE